MAYVRSAHATAHLAPLGGLVLSLCIGPPIAQGQDRGLPPENIPAPHDTLARSVGALRPGDVLKIAVYRDKEISGDYLIDSRGFLQMPGVGVITAAGLDPAQVTDRIRQGLIKRGFESPEIAVQPLVRVSVLGEVRTPALLPVEPGTSLIRLLSIAGGPSERADLRRVRVIRDGRVYEVDVGSGLGGSAAGRVVLFSNDVVVVPRRSGWTQENFAFLLGSVSALATVINLIVSLNIQRGRK
ncbi:MAG: hypothetical protein NVS4B3_13570 [Gemmatimonadaceae bacterium]